MSEMTNRIDELLADKAAVGLSPDEQRELDALLAEHSDVDVEAYELAAAALASAEAEPVEMSEALRQRILNVETENINDTKNKDRGSPILAFIRGAMSVAAIWAIVTIVSYMNQPILLTELTQINRILVQADDVQIATWSVFEPGYESVTGYVKWSDREQIGMLYLNDMPTNDPSKAQYQLWIVDPSRDAEPVDGGVFDIDTANSNVMIPIDAKLAINSPAAFAITLEHPGGVVVSEGPLLVVAPVTAP